MPRSVAEWRALLPREVSANECAVRIWTHCDHSYDSKGHPYMSLYDLANAVEALRSDVAKSGAAEPPETERNQSDGAPSGNADSASDALADAKPNRRRTSFYRLIFRST
jgi:hypothetical protein